MGGGGVVGEGLEKLEDENYILSVDDGDGGTITRNIGKRCIMRSVLNTLSFFFLNIVAKPWKCPEAFGNVGL